MYGFAANALTGTLSQTTFIKKLLSTPDKASRQESSGLEGKSFSCFFPSIGLMIFFFSVPRRRLCRTFAAGPSRKQVPSTDCQCCHFGHCHHFGRSPGGLVDVRMFIVALCCAVLVAYILAAVCALTFSFITVLVQWRLVLSS